jgi:hypothetical protein
VQWRTHAQRWGDDAFAAAWERGQALSLEQAIAEAIAAPAD